MVNVLEWRLWGLRCDCGAYGTVRLGRFGCLISAGNEGCGRASLVRGELDQLSTPAGTCYPAGLQEVTESHPALSFLSNLLQNESCSPHCKAFKHNLRRTLRLLGRRCHYHLSMPSFKLLCCLAFSLFLPCVWGSPLPPSSLVLWLFLVAHQA